MRKMRELQASDIKLSYDESIFQELSNSQEESIIFSNQKQTLDSIDFGLEMKEKGYNIFLTTQSTYKVVQDIEKHLKSHCKRLHEQQDWCYVYNFLKPENPIAINFQAGKGEEFKQDIEIMLNEFVEDLDLQFKSAEFDIQVETIKEEIKEKNQLLMNQIKKEAEKYDFEANITEKDIYFIPIIDGEKLSEEKFDELSETDQEYIVSKSEILQEKAVEVLEKVRKNLLDTEEKIKRLKYNIGYVLIGNYVELLKIKYQGNEKVGVYLETLGDDIIKNIEDFIITEQKSENILSFMPGISKGDDKSFQKKYKVNVVCKNSVSEYEKIIVGKNITMNSLIGTIQGDSDLNKECIDIDKIRPGLLHKANGGTLIIEMEDLLVYNFAWQFFRDVLKNQQIDYQLTKDVMVTAFTPIIEPEPIPLDIKVVLVGKPFHRQALHELDSAFTSLFKMQLYLEDEVHCDDHNLKKIVQFIKKDFKKQGFNPINKDIILRLLEYSSRMVMSLKWLPSDMEPLHLVIIEACELAKKQNKASMTVDLVEESILAKEMRINILEQKYDEMIEAEQIIIDTSGKKMGQVNALAVIGYNDYQFAKPTKITATVYKGESGIINIEKESNLSGNLHSKGVHVLTGYIGHKFAKEKALGITCQLCFEQSYNKVDGDSATCAELAAIISSISTIPIKQSMAVTGSMNQFGEVQPVGGVTLKVEGFYNVCKKRGLSGQQGVIIPCQNVKDLVLKQEVIEAIEEGLFHIYPVKKIEEALEYLLGYQIETIEHMTQKKLGKI